MEKMERFAPLERDYYCVEEDLSDKEYFSESSDDEVQNVIAEVAGVKPPEKKRKREEENNEFDRDMENEMSSAFEERTKGWFGRSKQQARGQLRIEAPKDVTMEDPSTSKSSKPDKKAVGDDSDSDDEELKLNAKGTESDDEFCEKEGIEKEPTDADLFYDPNADQDNQNWIDSHRKNCHVAQRLPNSDAVLNCPCCMGVLCYDCQRHDVYRTQYRAMFVVNCDVQDDQVLFQPRAGDRSKKQKMKELSLKTGQKLTVAPPGCDPNDLFRSVLCSHCKTEVAVFDSNEVYHFFNVLASYA